MAGSKTVIVTGASQGIGAAVTRAFLDRGYNVVATSLKFSGTDFVASANRLRWWRETSAWRRRREKISQTAIAEVRLHRSRGEQCGHFLWKAVHGIHH